MILRLAIDGGGAAFTKRQYLYCERQERRCTNKREQTRELGGWKCRSTDETELWRVYRLLGLEEGSVSIWKSNTWPAWLCGESSTPMNKALMYVTPFLHLMDC